MASFLQYKEMKDKHDYLAHLRRRHRRGHRQDARHVRRLHRGAAIVRQLRDADELPALQQDEGHGPDRQLVGARREPPLRGHHQAVPRLREGARLPDPRRSRKRSVDTCQKTVRLEDAFIDLAFEHGPGRGHDRQARSRSTSATSPTGASASSASRRSTWSTSTPSPGSPRCSTASSTPTSSKPARPNIRRPRPRAAGTTCGTRSTGGRRRKAANDAPARRAATGGGYVRGGGGGGGVAAGGARSGAPMSFDTLTSVIAPYSKEIVALLLSLMGTLLLRVLQPRAKLDSQSSASISLSSQ